MDNKNEITLIEKWVYNPPYTEFPKFVTGYMDKDGDENGWSGIYDIFVTEDGKEQYTSWFNSREEAIQDKIDSIEFEKSQVELFFKQDMEVLDEKLAKEKEKLGK